MRLEDEDQDDDEDGGGLRRLNPDPRSLTPELPSPCEPKALAVRIT